MTNYSEILKSKNFIKYSLAFIIFILGIGIYIFPFQNMRPLNEDFAVIYWAKDLSYKMIKKVFTENINLTFYLSELFSEKAPTEGLSWTTVYYRPLSFVFTSVLYNLFGIASAVYFIANIMLHTVNSLLVFYMLNWFMTIWLAFLGALFFLFHASLYHMLPYACTAQDPLNLLFILLAIIALQSFFIKKSYRYYLLSAFFFTLALFTRETAIIMPFALALIIWFKIWISDQHKKKSYSEIIKYSWLFFAIASCYLLLRYYLFGPAFNTSSSFFTIDVINFIKINLWNGLEIIKNFLGFSFLENSNSLQRACILTPVMLSLFTCLWYNPKKSFILLLGIVALSSAWPAFYKVFGHPRYIYPALPFFILGLIFTILNTELFRAEYRPYILATFLFGSIIWGIQENYKQLGYLQKTSLITDRCLQSFYHKHGALFTPTNTICFTSVPAEIFHVGLIHALRLYSKQFDLAAGQLFVTYFSQGPEVKENLSPNVFITDNGFKLSSPNYLELYFKTNPIEPTGIPIVTNNPSRIAIIVHTKATPWKATDVSVQFNRKNSIVPEQINLLIWNGSGFTEKKLEI